jgi:exosortase
MLTIEKDLKATVAAVPEERSQLGKWRPAWLLLLAANGVCCVVVWANTLAADNVRQILAGTLAALSAFLIWKKSASPNDKPSQVGALALTAVCLVVFASGYLHITRIYLLANIALLATFVWAIYGLDRSKKFGPPAFLALFTLPDLPEEFRAYLFIPLQHLCTFTAAETAKLFIPITYSGHLFVVNGHKFDVAPSCSGLGMWACFLFAFAIWQTFKSYKPSAYVVAFLMDPILTIALNTVRIALTAIVAYYHSVKMALAIHSNLEFVLVPLGLLILWKVGERFAETK